MQILARAFSPFQPPTSQTKSTFETKTSAINVAPSPHAPYDIKQIRDDTIWLSKEINIDEVSALRIVVLEWQTRPVVQLLHGDLEGEARYLNGGGDAGDFRASVFDPGSSILAKSTNQQKQSTTSTSFGESGARRRRLLETYLSERRCILKCNEHLIFVTLFESDNSSSSPEGQQSDRLTWLREAGANVLPSWNSGGVSQAKQKHAVLEAVDALRARLEGVSKGCGWLQDEDRQEDIEVAWARSQILEMIHIMQIILHLLDSSTELYEPSVILPWFRLMKDYEFYDSMQLVSKRRHDYKYPLTICSPLYFRSLLIYLLYRFRLSYHSQSSNSQPLLSYSSSLQPSVSPQRLREIMCHTSFMLPRSTRSMIL